MRAGPRSASRWSTLETARSRSARTIISSKPIQRSSSIVRQPGGCGSTFRPEPRSGLNLVRPQRYSSSLSPANDRCTAFASKSWVSSTSLTQELRFAAGARLNASYRCPHATQGYPAFRP